MASPVSSSFCAPYEIETRPLLYCSSQARKDLWPGQVQACGREIRQCSREVGKGSSGLRMASPVSSSFCAPYETQLVVKQKSVLKSRQHATDGQGGLRFKMTDESGFLKPPKRTMFDAVSGNQLLTILGEGIFISTPYMAFRGGNALNRLLFTFKVSKAFFKPTSYEVFLPGNNQSSNPDFSLQENSRWRTGFSILSRGRIIAKAEKSGRGMVYCVKVYPGVDQAFIAAVTMLWMVERDKQQIT